MKKIISVILASCFVFLLSPFASAASIDDTNVFYYEDSEIIIEGEHLNYDEMKRIADYISGDLSIENNTADSSSVYGLMCTLFGHNIEKSTAKEISHNVYSTAPKCLEKTYEVKTCSRCDYIEKTLISSKRINCHWVTSINRNCRYYKFGSFCFFDIFYKIPDNLIFSCHNISDRQKLFYYFMSVIKLDYWDPTIVVLLRQ